MVHSGLRSRFMVSPPRSQPTLNLTRKGENIEINVTIVKGYSNWMVFLKSDLLDVFIVEKFRNSPVDTTEHKLAPRTAQGGSASTLVKIAIPIANRL